jgi:hypothetical protein
MLRRRGGHYFGSLNIFLWKGAGDHQLAAVIRWLELPCVQGLMVD